MEAKKKINIKLKDEYRKFLLENNPEAFEKIENTIKIKSKYKTFYKIMITTITHKKFLLDKIGATYLGYLNLLLDSITYENTVDFNILKEYGVKLGMINVCKKRFTEMDIIKKYNGYYYVNPTLFIKGETVNPTLLNIFGITEL